MIEQAFVRSYNILCQENSAIVENFIKRLETSLKPSNNESKIRRLDTEIRSIEEQKSKLLDLFLQDTVDKDTLESKQAELDEKLRINLAKKATLIEDKKLQEDIDSRIAGFRASINTNKKLECFDRAVFECIIDRVIVGEKKEDGTLDPYTLTFVYKTGVEDKVAAKQPSSSAKACSHPNTEVTDACLQPIADTC